jgi:hypothetical protein
LERSESWVFPSKEFLHQRHSILLFYYDKLNLNFISDVTLYIKIRIFGSRIADYLNRLLKFAFKRV